MADYNSPDICNASLIATIGIIMLALLGAGLYDDPEGSFVECISWQTPRGMVGVVLDDRKDVESVMWTAKHSPKCGGFGRGH